MSRYVIEQELEDGRWKKLYNHISHSIQWHMQSLVENMYIAAYSADAVWV